MNITIYGRSTCAPCRTLKAYLNTKSIPFTEIDVDLDLRAAQEAYDLGGAVVPLTVVDTDSGRHVVRGLNIAALTALL